ncbi:hypothetical protein SAMN05661044_00665 [Olivibacter domesticus]|uniref:Uncharacterized protein n=2 Tax=Olivibacter domesticus TaxID=407022 RepID=A0A1H7IDB4_OLID1|nr:hypothetical protein SAMN05661044_00665 [Olivibacter domesticus]
MKAGEVGRIIDTILSIPGMNDPVKIDLKMSRKQVLLLSNVIARGLNGKDEQADGLLESLSSESKGELELLSAECLQKAGLTELYEKLRALGK